MEETTQPYEVIPSPIKLLLFIDKRPSSGEYAQQLRNHLKLLNRDQNFSLDVVDVSEQPYLAEHFRLVATPALVKFSPGVQQVLMGSNIISQLDHWWPQWQQEAEATIEILHHSSVADRDDNGDQAVEQGSLAHSVEIMKLSDQIFKLNQEREDLAAQLRFKNQLVSMLAHDLRNPLTAASIAVDTLEMGYAPKPDGQKLQLSPQLTSQLLHHAKTQIRAIDRMITDILQTAKGAAADLQLQPQEMVFQDLCKEVLESMQSKFLAKSQTIGVDIPQDLPRVYVDGGQVRRVLYNLLDNAIKYTPPGGEVKLLALHRTTQKIQVGVQDTGPGIPEENQERIFEESFRLQRDQSQDGYGLGLALCQRIIRAHYGQIWVESKVGAGSQFFFTLPVYKS